MSVGRSSNSPPKYFFSHHSTVPANYKKEDVLGNIVVIFLTPSHLNHQLLQVGHPLDSTHPTFETVSIP